MVERHGEQAWGGQVPGQFDRQQHRVETARLEPSRVSGATLNPPPGTTAVEVFSLQHTEISLLLSSNTCETHLGGMAAVFVGSLDRATVEDQQVDGFARRTTVDDFRVESWLVQQPPLAYARDL